MGDAKFIVGLLLVLVLVGTVGCTGTVTDDQVTKLTNQITALQNSLNATQQELVSTKQTLQQLQSTNSHASYPAPVNSTTLMTSSASSPSVPVIKSFTVTPSTITKGQAATLEWDVIGTCTVFINQGIGNVSSSGTRIISPSATMTYILTATHFSASYVTASATVTVNTYSSTYWDNTCLSCPWNAMYSYPCYNNTCSSYYCNETYSSPYYSYCDPCLYQVGCYSQQIKPPIPPPPPPPPPNANWTIAALKQTFDQLPGEIRPKVRHPLEQGRNGSGGRSNSRAQDHNQDEEIY